MVIIVKKFMIYLNILVKYLGIFCCERYEISVDDGINKNDNHKT